MFRQFAPAGSFCTSGYSIAFWHTRRLVRFDFANQPRLFGTGVLPDEAYGLLNPKPKVLFPEAKIVRVSVCSEMSTIGSPKRMKRESRSDA